jgi:hypothetical protein
MHIGISSLAKAAMIAGLGMSAGGCALMHAQSRIDPRTVASYDHRQAHGAAATPAQRGCFISSYDGDSNDGVVDLTCARFPEVLDDDGPTAYALATTYPLPYHTPRTARDQTLVAQPIAASVSAAATAPTATAPAVPPATPADMEESQRRQYRNRLGSLLMKHSDDICIASIGRAANNEAVTNAALNTLTTTLATVASIVTGQEAQRILAGGAAISSGTRDHVNAAVFRNVLVSAVSRAIGDERRTLANRIQEHMTQQTTANYDADTMIRDINVYHQSCSFIRGLELVTRAVDRSAVSDRTEQIARYDQAIAFLDARLKQGGLAAAEATALTTQRSELTATRNRLFVANDLPVSPSAPTPTPAPPQSPAPAPTPAPPTPSPTPAPKPGA